MGTLAVIQNEHQQRLQTGLKCQSADQVLALLNDVCGPPVESRWLRLGRTHGRGFTRVGEIAPTFECIEHDDSRRVLVLNLERRVVGFARKANDLREGVVNL
jgi:hypothetical protein